MKSNELKREELKNFIVRVEYINGDASGVIIKTKLSAYVITVKHTFNERDSEPLSRVKLVDVDSIKVYDYDKKTIPITEVIFLENKELDITLFKIDVEKFKKIEKIDTLELYMGEFNFCAIAGYPQSRKDNQSVIIQASNPDEIEEDSFSIQLKAESQIVSYNKSEMDTLRGLSGGGVFKRGESGKIYLIGIQYEYIGYANLLKILDLRTIINEIESKIDEKLLLGKYPFFEKLGIDASKLNFESLENSFRLNKDIEKIKKQKDEYKFLLEDNRKNRNLEKSYISLKKKMKRLSNIYFYHGKVFFENNDRARAFNAFTRAMELYPEWKNYLLKDEFKEDILTDKQKEEREKSEEDIRPSFNSDITTIILEDNIKSNIKTNNMDSLEKNIEKLISFLSQNFEKNKKRIIGWLIKLSKVKLKNGEPLEAEKILLDARDKLDDKKQIDEVNSLLIIIYERLITLNDNSISSVELRLKLEKILISLQVSSKQYIFVQNMIVKSSKNKYVLDDCFIEHLASQRKEIKELKDKNYSLQLENNKYYSQNYYQPIFLKDSNKEKNFLDIYCKVRFVIITILGTIPLVVWLNTWLD